MHIPGNNLHGNYVVMCSSRWVRTFNLMDNPDYTKSPRRCDAKKTNDSIRAPRQRGLEARKKLGRKHERKHQHQIQFAINMEMHSGKFNTHLCNSQQGSEALLLRDLFQGTLLTTHPFHRSTSGIQTFTMAFSLLKMHLRKHQ